VEQVRDAVTGYWSLTSRNIAEMISDAVDQVWNNKRAGEIVAWLSTMLLQ